MRFGAVQVQVQLSRVCGAELAHFQIDDHQATQSAVKKHQVNTKPGVIKTQSFLPANKGKVGA